MEEGIYLFKVKEKFPKVDENISLIHQNLDLVQEDGPIPGGKKTGKHHFLQSKVDPLP